MKVSLNWAQYYSNVDLVGIGTDEILKRIGAQLGAVEEVVQWGPRYREVVVVKIMSCIKHPNANRLSLCTIDDGGAVKNIKRDKDGYVQVVCGAPNVQAGLTVAWIPPGATVPSTIEKDPFVLDAREIRGYVSSGMLASPAELGISEDHSGILVLKLDQLAKGTKPGTSFAEALWLSGEAVIDLENKMFTHRPDCFGILGVARELAGIQGKAFKSPDWYTENPSLPKVEGKELKLRIRNDIPKLVRRFVAVAISDVAVKPSPLHIQFDLKRVGIKPINNIVDLTNYYMHLTGQPIHAYDYDKVKALGGADGVELHIRHPRSGEKIRLLSGKEIKPNEKTMMVATANHLICLGGAMGGVETEVDSSTKNIIIEAANWDMYTIRRTAMEYGVFTDAVTRFTKGQSPLQNLAVVARITEDIQKLAGGKVASDVQDVKNSLPKQKLITVDIDFINERLGSSLTAPAAAKLLQNVEIQTEVHGNKLEITPPFWRTDLEIPEDIVEEIGRLYGYDKLPVVLPPRSAKPTPRNVMREFKSRLRVNLREAGASELLTYSFVHGDMLSNYGQDEKHAYRLSNALSPALQYYRLSLLPSLLEKVHSNIKAGHEEFVLYEINPVHSKQKLNDEKLPKELEHLALVIASDDKVVKKRYAGASYYQAVKYLWSALDSVLDSSTLRLEPLGGHKLKDYEAQWAAPFEPKRSAVVVDQANNIYGFVGEFKSVITQEAKLPAFSAGFELDIELLQQLPQLAAYRPLSRFPSSSQDISLSVPAKTTFQELVSVIQSQLSLSSQQDGYWSELRPLDIYQDKPDIKHMTFRITLTHPQKTLTTNEVSAVIDDVAAVAEQKLDAKRL